MGRVFLHHPLGQPGKVADTLHRAPLPMSDTDSQEVLEVPFHPAQGVGEALGSLRFSVVEQRQLDDRGVMGDAGTSVGVGGPDENRLPIGPQLLDVVTYRLAIRQKEPGQVLIGQQATLGISFGGNPVQNALLEFFHTVTLVEIHIAASKQASSSGPSRIDSLSKAFPMAHRL
jgi:hypothetical protein